MTPTVLLPGLALGADGPVFDHPWQAQAFALVVKLHEAGHFAWKDWVALFSGHIKAMPALPGEHYNDTYYRQWVAALEQLVQQLGLADRHAIDSRSSEWHTAYVNTPHGQPVALANALCPPAHAHTHHTARGAPVTVCPAHHA